MAPLVRGCYEFHFDSPDDLRRIWSAGTVNLQQALLRLSKWTKDFNRYSQRQIHDSIWIRLIELPQEYWRERTLKEIANAIGTPIDLDGPTHSRAFGHYARILVDIDLSKRVFDEIMAEREGYVFKVEVQYERRPLFCHHCYVIGHNVTTCKWMHPEAAHTLDRGKKTMVDVDSCKQKKTTDACAFTSRYVPVNTTSCTVVNKDQSALVVIAATATIEQSIPTTTMPISSDTAFENVVNQHRTLVETTITTYVDQPISPMQVPKNTASVDVMQNDCSLAGSTFILALQNVTDLIPQGGLPSPSGHVLE